MNLSYLSHSCYFCIVKNKCNTNIATDSTSYFHKLSYPFHISIKKITDLLIVVDKASVACSDT